MFRKFSKVKLWVKVIAVGIPLALVGYLVWNFIFIRSHWCGPGVERVEDQCIGVTDGGGTLSGDLADVLGKIKKENDLVEKDPDAVSVAYLMPLPKSSDDELTTVIRNELKGAYVAQFQGNHTQTLAGNKPPIRLLVANSGDESSHGQQVVSDLLDKVNGPQRLVAVVVTGRTKVGLIDAIDALRLQGVPVVTSRLANDRLTNLPPATHMKGGLARTAPTTSDEAAAAAAYLKLRASSALIVRDTNPNDPALQSLDESFRQTFQDNTHKLLEPAENYNSGLDGFSSTMRGMLLNICQQKPDAVFFAGRSVGLAAFVQELPRRPCQDLQVNIVAPGDAVEFANMTARGNQPIRDGLSKKASVKYTAQAHPKSWDKSPESFLQAATEQFKLNFNTQFPGETFEDGTAIIGYDAIVTTITAIRGSAGTINDKPDLVTQEFNRMHGKGAVAGASGWISLDNHGISVNKAVVILEVKPDGTQEFVELSAPTGSPCVPDIPPC